MSSEVSGGGVIAGAVMLPVAAAFGAGWLAWQTGKLAWKGAELLIEANRAIDREIAEARRKREEAAKQRKQVALAGHNQLVDMCMQILAQIESGSSVMGFAEREQLAIELRELCHATVPEETAQIESFNSFGFLKLDRIIQKQKQLASLTLSDSELYLYRGLSVADLMDDLKIAFAACEIQETVGKDIKAADPIVLERAKLNEQLSVVTSRIVSALDHIEQLTATYGLTSTNRTWINSCFNGIDLHIQRLYNPTTKNSDLKKGIKRLEEVMEQYNMVLPNIEKDQMKFASLYQVYVDGCKALGEPIESKKAIQTLPRLEAKLSWLKERADRAQICAEIYQKLGAEAYLCYAWDTELQALGYSVYSKKEIAEMANFEPQRAKVGEKKLPFYQWGHDNMTLLYSIAEQCALQVVVHDDGTVSMQTIADCEDDKTKNIQIEHCSLSRQLRDNLKRNWFIMYDFQEVATADNILTVAEWQSSKENEWYQQPGTILTDERKKREEATHARVLR